MAVPSPGPRSDKTPPVTPPPGSSRSPPRVTTSQRHPAAMRCHGIAAPPQTSPTTSRAPLAQFQMSQLPLHSCVTVRSTLTSAIIDSLDSAGDRAGRAGIVAPCVLPHRPPTDDVLTDVLTNRVETDIKALPSTKMIKCPLEGRLLFSTST